MAEPESREDNIYFARLSEQGERYEDMIKYMKKVASVSFKINLLLICTYFYLLKFSITKTSQTTKEIS